MALRSFDRLIAWTKVLAPAFTRPGFVNALVVACGWLLTRGTHTITQSLVGLGIQGRVHHERLHRFFSRGSWSVDDLGCLLFTKVAEHYNEPSNAIGVRCSAAGVARAISLGTSSTRSRRDTRCSDHACVSRFGSYRHSLCCESVVEERSAENPQATFCGSRRRVTAPGDPVGGRALLHADLTAPAPRPLPSCFTANLVGTVEMNPSPLPR